MSSGAVEEHDARAEGPRRRPLFHGLMILAFVMIGGSALLIMGTGGFYATVLGMKLELFSPRKLWAVAIAMASVGVMVAPLSAREAFQSIGRRLDDSPRLALALIIAPGFYFAVLKLWQFHTFQVSAWDLVIQSGVAWNTAHGNWFWEPLQQINYLGDHYSPFYILIAPLYRLWPSAALLLVLQTVGLAIGAAIIYRLARRHIGSAYAALALVLLYWVNRYLNSIQEYDFHPIAFAVPLYMAMFWAAERERKVVFVIAGLLAISVEETLIPPLIGICVWTAFTRPKMRLWASVLILIAAVLLPVIVGDLMVQHLYDSRGFIGSTHASRWSHLGASEAQIVETVLKHPWKLLTAFSSPPEKLLRILQLFASIAFLPFFGGAALLMAAIPIATISSCNLRTMYDYHFHYSATTLPLLFYCAILGLRRARAFASTHRHNKAIWLGLVLIGFASGTWNSMNMPRYLDHWDRQKVAAFHCLVETVPAGAPVQASMEVHFLLPHLSDRKVCTLYYGTNLIAPWLLLDNSKDAPQIAALLAGGEWNVRCQGGGVSLMEKRAPPHAR